MSSDGVKRKKHCPIIRYGWSDALRHVAEGGTVRVMKAGHAEVHGGKLGNECLGYMTKESLSIYRLCRGKVTE
jgi:hypothetical protein